VQLHGDPFQRHGRLRAQPSREPELLPLAFGPFAPFKCIAPRAKDRQASRAFRGQQYEVIPLGIPALRSVHQRLQETSRTVVLDPAGRIHRQCDGNTWKAVELADALTEAVNLAKPPPPVR
jgi:hypothetical protein